MKKVTLLAVALIAVNLVGCQSIKKFISGVGNTTVTTATNIVDTITIPLPPIQNN